MRKKRIELFRIICIELGVIYTPKKGNSNNDSLGIGNKKPSEIINKLKIIR